MYSWTLVASEILKAWCEVHYLFEFCLLRPLLDNEGKINRILDIILSIFDWRGLTHWYLQHWLLATIIEKRGAPTSDFGYVRLQFYYSNTWWLYDLHFKKKMKTIIACCRSDHIPEGRTSYRHNSIYSPEGSNPIQ